MARPVFYRDRAVEILLDALAIGDAQACARSKISLRTLQAYRARLRSDAELARLFAEKKSAAQMEWQHVRVRFLRRALAKAEQLIEQATPAQLRDVMGAIKIAGELEVASGALGVHESHATDRPGAEPAAAAAVGGVVVPIRPD